jgi:EAL domain-containing protein (putative c-di-GMP-specific phosphodiesterase class I)
VHGLKIDRSFVATVPHQRRSMAVVEGLAKMAHAMGLVVTAEGVETKAQAMFLRGCGIHRMQGFMFGEPLASEDFIDACRDRNRYELSARIGQALKGA